MKRTLFPLITLALVLAAWTPALALDVDLSSPMNYAGQSGTGSYVGTATTLSFVNNDWAVVALDSPFTVEADSILRFSYQSSALPELAAIIFDTNTSYYATDANNAFWFGGTQTTGWSADPYADPYQAGDGLVTYTVKLTDFLVLGQTFTYLAFSNDDDAVRDGCDYVHSAGVFSNVSLSATPIPGAIWLLGSGLAGLVGLRRRKTA